MWRTFNCGIGYTVIVAPEAVEATLGVLGTLGLSANVIGEIVPASGDRALISA
jgi:phosphoribosylformylglycinamidine cyclo-ligase